jgi:acylaminoacyl-peptidase
LSYGFAILHVNYRGSTGFGTGPLESLAGKIGENDVDDVYQAVLEALKEEGAGGKLDRARVGIVGGSHGGFLGAHSIAQHPDLFRVAALRNPVTNIASMTTSTDIPDWCWGESLGLQSYDYSTFKAPSGEYSYLCFPIFF